MKIIKICLRDGWSYSSEKALSEAIRLGAMIHFQKLDKEKYKRWMKNSLSMIWSDIMDIYCPTTEIFALVSQELKGSFDDADIYYVDVFQEYKTPIDGAEIITSTYLWNYNTTANDREIIMKEHFEMEKCQIYYDYVVFQIVTQKINDNSPDFDFFFVSHVSDPKGIDVIYSMPSLGGMREHSEAFLNTKTRRLAFGSVTIVK